MCHFQVYDKYTSVLFQPRLPQWRNLDWLSVQRVWVSDPMGITLSVKNRLVYSSSVNIDLDQCKQAAIAYEAHSLFKVYHIIVANTHQLFQFRQFGFGYFPGFYGCFTASIKYLFKILGNVGQLLKFCKCLFLEMSNWGLGENTINGPNLKQLPTVSAPEW